MPALAMLAAFLFGLSCSSMPEEDGSRIETKLVGAQKETVGSAVLVETQTGVRVTIQVDGLPSGEYRYQFFSNPVCGQPNFRTAGEPFPDPAEVAMARNMSPAVSRSIGRLAVDSDGKGRAERVAPVVTLGPGGNSLLDGGGSALVISERRAGGARVACGVIAR